MMQKIIACLVIVLLLAGCAPEETQQEKPSATINDTFIKNDTIAASLAPEKAEEPVATCDCVPVKDYDYSSKGVSWRYFEDGQDKREQDSILQYHLHNPQSLKTKVLRLFTNRVLPPEIKKFKDVEHIMLSGSISPTLLKNLDMFPELVSVIFYGCTVEFDTTQAWLKKIERLHFAKCKMKGLTSFKQTPRLKSLLIGHAGFDYFPKDFNSLACLQEFDIEEYKFGKEPPPIHDMDLRRFACLKTFRVWGGAGGLPQGVDSIGKIKLILRPWAMSDTELVRYKAYQKRVK